MPTDKRQRQKEGQRARREAALAAARRRQRRQRLIIALVIAVAIVLPLLVIAGTGGKSGGGKETLALDVANGRTVSVKVDKDPPSKLVIKDLKKGTGKTAKLNDNIEVNYVGVTYADGKEFDSSFSRGQTVTFPLKVGGLIEGWTKGIPGMRVGGRRELIIPAKEAYGDNPAGGQPAGTLVFIVDLVSIKPVTPATTTTTAETSSTTSANG